MKLHRSPASRSSFRILYLVGALSLTIASWACNTSPSPTKPTVEPSATPPSPPGPAGPVGPTGSYSLTLTASPSCAVLTDWVSNQPLPFPDSVRVRRYDAEFAGGAALLTAADGTGNRVGIGGTDHYLYQGMALMSLNGDQLTIVVPPADGGGYIKATPSCAGGDYWWELLNSTPGDNEAFESCGTWRGSMVDPKLITGTISGTFAYYRGVGPRWTTGLFCRASDHHFALTKR